MIMARENFGMMMTDTTTQVLRTTLTRDKMLLNETQYIPKLSVNLLSGNKIVSRRYTMVFSDADCKVLNSNGGVAATLRG